MLRSVSKYNEEILERLEKKYLEPVEAKPIYECDYCGNYIYYGEVYYEMELELLCEDCFMEHVKDRFLRRAGEE